MKCDLPRGFNWLTVLTELSDGKEITNSRYHQLSSMAGGWPTCACGQLCDALPRGQMGEPRDSKLRYWGAQFADQVDQKKWCLALATFQKIEARTTELLIERGVISPSLAHR